MRKSSLGSRRSVQPVRLDSDDGRASFSRRATINDSAKRTSSIPRPGFSVAGRGRRSSSETRDAQKMGSVPMLKRSKSQLSMQTAQTIATPLNARRPPMHMGSGGSQRFTPCSEGGYSARKSNYSGTGGGKVKDTRNLSDKAFQAQEIQRIQNFFNCQPSVQSFLPKGLNLRQPILLKTFVDLVNYLLSRVDENVRINMSNYVEEIPFVMKKYGYPGTISPSWLKTANTPHALPHVLGLLSWLVSLVECIPPDDFHFAALADDDDEDQSFMFGTAKDYLEHFIIQYHNWNREDDAAEQEEHERFLQHLRKNIGISDEDVKQLEDEVAKLKAELNDPKEVEEMEARLAEENKFQTLVNDVKKLEAHKSRLEDFLNNKETALDEEKQKLLEEELVLKNLQHKEKDLMEQVSKQLMTAQERDELIKTCHELASSIRSKEELITTILNEGYKDDLQLAKCREKLKKKSQIYNKTVMMESCWLPELKDLEAEINVLHSDALEQLEAINSIGREMRDNFRSRVEAAEAAKEAISVQFTQVEENVSKLTDNVKHLEERAQQQEQTIQTFKTRTSEESAKMKKDIDKLRTDIEKLLSSDLDDKPLLQSKILKRDALAADIRNLIERANYFFKRSHEITYSYITDVLSYEAETNKKVEEFLEAWREKLRNHEEVLAKICSKE